MTITKTIPAENLRSLDLHEGDTLRVISASESEFTVEVRRETEALPAIRRGAAREWVRHAKGIVKLAPGETADDLRMAYYREKYGLEL